MLFDKEHIVVSPTLIVQYEMSFLNLQGFYIVDKNIRYCNHVTISKGPGAFFLIGNNNPSIHY